MRTTSLNADLAQAYFVGRPQIDVMESGAEIAERFQQLASEKHDRKDAEASSALDLLPYTEIGDGADGIIEHFKCNTSLRILPVLNGQNAPIGVIREANTIRSDFSAATIGFYSAKDQKQGYTRSIDSNGRQNTHGLLSCSVGVAQLKIGERITSLERFGYSISQIKKAAKAAPHGVVVGNANAFNSQSPANQLQTRILAANN